MWMRSFQSSPKYLPPELLPWLPPQAFLHLPPSHLPEIILDILVLIFCSVLSLCPSATFHTILKSVLFPVLEGGNSICLALMVFLSLIQSRFRGELDFWSVLILPPLSTLRPLCYSAYSRSLRAASRLSARELAAQAFV